MAPDPGADDALEAALRALREGRVFFAFGVPKSGTTFLQMLLNAHPEVSCPSEHQFDFFVKRLPELLTAYNKVLREVDRRTARQGATPLTDDDARELLRCTLLTILHAAGRRKGARFLGANDNALMARLPLYGGLLPGARFICIVRDPRDVIVSSWHFNLRIEPGFLARAGSLEDWTRTVSQLWESQMRELTRLQGAAPFDDALLFVRYEDLMAEPAARARTLFGHLGAASDPALIAGAVEATAFAGLKERQGQPDHAFYRRGAAGAWREELSPALAETVGANAAEMMARFGYL